MRSQQLALPRSAAVAGPAGDVGQHGAEIAPSQPRHPVADFEHLDGDLVPEHAGVQEEVLHAPVGVVVRSADPDPTHRDKHLVGSGIGGVAMVDEEHVPRTLQHCRLHGTSCYVVGGRPRGLQRPLRTAATRRRPYWN